MTKNVIDESGHIEPVAFGSALGERYLAYAMSTIMSRSLPDVRDGLKPVHRRLLYAMLQLKLDPQSGFKKCARVVGDVIGKYHPHGDGSVYDAMVRLAQSFAVRYPLVDGQGNFGSVDGDNAAAMRYTEARLTEVATLLLQDIEQDTVDFRPNYDGSEEEPAILPANFPNLLANGSEGIAVGMATSIPPHNVAELADALIYLIKHPNASTEKLVEFVPGPDFPSGGTIVEPKESIISAYETGKGSFRLRAAWSQETLGHGMYQIVVTEIPYQVQKSRLMEKMAELFKAKKLALLGNIKDESAEDIRIILEPKNRSVDPDMLMESLFKLTDLETRITLNMNVLTANAVPRVLGLREALQAFLEHRHDVLIRRSHHRLAKIERRLEILDGLIITYLNLDEVIRIIREEDDAKHIMMERWKLSELQVEAILNMRLRSLRKLEEVAIRKEHDELSAERDDINETLNDETKRWRIISDETKQLKKQFGPSTEIGARRTAFAEAPAGSQVISIEAFVEREPITILCSKMGWIKALKGHTNSLDSVKYKEGDEERFALKAQTTDKLIVFTSDGKCFTLPCDKLPKGKGFGEPIRLMADMDQASRIIALFIYNPEGKLLVTSTGCRGFVVNQKDIMAQTKSGKQVLNTSKGDKAFACTDVEGDTIAIIGTNRKLLVFPISEIPEMKRGQGVILQRYKQGKIADVKTFNIEDGLSWQLGERTRTEHDLTPWIGHRAGAGRLPPVGFPKTNKF